MIVQIARNRLEETLELNNVEIWLGSSSIQTSRVSQISSVPKTQILGVWLPFLGNLE